MDKQQTAFPTAREAEKYLREQMRQRASGHWVNEPGQQAKEGAGTSVSASHGATDTPLLFTYYRVRRQPEPMEDWAALHGHWHSADWNQLGWGAADHPPSQYRPLNTLTPRQVEDQPKSLPALQPSGRESLQQEMAELRTEIRTIGEAVAEIRRYLEHGRELGAAAYHYVQHVEDCPQIKSVHMWEADEIVYLLTLIEVRSDDEEYAVYRLQGEVKAAYPHERVLFTTIRLDLLEDAPIDDFLGPQAREIYHRES